MKLVIAKVLLGINVAFMVITAATAAACTVVGDNVGLTWALIIGGFNIFNISVSRTIITQLETEGKTK